MYELPNRNGKYTKSDVLEQNYKFPHLTTNLAIAEMGWKVTRLDTDNMLDESIVPRNRDEGYDNSV